MILICQQSRNCRYDVKPGVAYMSHCGKNDGLHRCQTSSGKISTWTDKQFIFVYYVIRFVAAIDAI